MDAHEAYAPNARQHAFHADPRPWRWYCAGYGSGKTTATVLEAFSLATLHHPGYTGIVAAPTYPLLMQSWFEEWRRWIPQACWRLRRDPLYGPQLFVRCPDGQTSTLFLRSTSNPWSNEGINAAWLVFDEVTRERDRAAFDVLIARVRRGVPGRQRAVLVSGPPQSRRHWTAVEWGAGPDATHAGDLLTWHDARHAAIRARTRDNDRLPPDYEAGLRARPGATRAWCGQFLDAEFGALEGQIYEAFSREVHVVPQAALEGRVWRHVGVGVDWGYTAPGAMVVLAEDGLGDRFVLHEEVHAQKTVSDAPDGWIPIAVSLVKRFRLEWFACDPSLPGHLRMLHEGLRRANVPRRVFGGDNDIAEGVRRVAARLEWAAERARHPGRPGRPGLYVASDCHRTIAEFETWARRRDRAGALTETPEDRDDHCLDGVRYHAMARAA